MPDFSNLKVDDEIIVDLSSTGETVRHLVGGVVIARTKTRLTVRYGGEKGYSQVFSNDGRQFPRPSGYGGSKELMEITPDSIKALRRSRLTISVRNKSWNLDRLLGNSRNLAALSTDDLQKVAAAVQNIVDLVKEVK